MPSPRAVADEGGVTPGVRSATMFFAGALGGVVSRSATAPMDRLRLVAAGHGLSVARAFRVIRRDGAPPDALRQRARRRRSGR